MPLEFPEIQLGAIGPEIALGVTALVILLIDAFFGGFLRRGADEGRGGWHLPIMATIGLVISVELARRSWVDLEAGPELQLAGTVALDRFSLFAKVALAGFGLLAVWSAREYLSRERLDESEFYALVLLAVAGMMLMTAATDLILMFIALETFSIALYVLVGFRRGGILGQESAMKYLLLGAFSSAFFLLGIALTYGATGATNLYGAPGTGASGGIVRFITDSPGGDLGFLALAISFLVVGLGFKIAAVPFHMWTPDAYQGAPSPVTGFMAAATKLAAFAAIIRLFVVVLFPLRDDWRPLLIGLAVLSMVFGSLFALVQEDIKRILAYSSIAHAGFLLIGVIAATDRGIAATLFYLVTYGITVLGAFAVVTVVGGPEERRVRLVDYKGLFFERPLLAGVLSLFLLSLAGVPLTAGFVGKLVVFGAGIEADLAWLAVLGVLASAVATFFYLRIMVVMYMQEPDEPGAPIKILPAATTVIALTGAATLFFGLFWGPLFRIAEQATLYFFAGP
jgi:NADH-quinone oxidoreductase subunit N